MTSESGYSTGLAQVELRRGCELYSCVFIDPKLARHGTVIDIRHRDPILGGMTRGRKDKDGNWVLSPVPWSCGWIVLHDARPSPWPAIETKARISKETP